jgi:programmed cell death 6-interacting protein
VRKRAETGVKPSLLAKLAQQGADWFNLALAAAQGPSLAGQLDGSWPAHLTFQGHSFGAAAQYWQSLHAREVALVKGQGYAEEITRIRAAQAAAAQALAVAAAHNMAATLTASVTDLLAKLATSLAAALADNRTIYLEVEPLLDGLPPIAGASPVKPTPPTLGLPAGAAPLLATLLPVAATRALEATRDALATAASVAEAQAKQVATLC